jgi:hypothetical protein
MIVCPHLGVKGWHGRIRNKIAADSIYDRLAHGPHEIMVGGEMRKLIAEKALPAEAGKRLGCQNKTVYTITEFYHITKLNC